LTEHQVMANFLHNVKCRVLLSSYPSDLYNDLYQGWRCVQRKTANHSSHEKIKEKKIECLWMNF